MVKRVGCLFMSVLFPILGMAQRYTERGYEVIGLADGEEITESLAIGIPLLLVGFLIAYIFMWSKSEEEKREGKGSTIGCIGVIIMGIGFIFLLPLLAWIEAIGMILFSAIVVIILICALWAWLTGK